MHKYVVLIFLLSCSLYVSAQSKSKNNEKSQKKSQIDRGATYSDPSDSKKKVKVKYKYNYNADVKEFDKLMQANAKKYKKRDRLMEKPRYSDPTYFGHKKKPKKRARGKRKLCKECNIVH